MTKRPYRKLRSQFGVSQIFQTMFCVQATLRHLSLLFRILVISICLLSAMEFANLHNIMLFLSCLRSTVTSSTVRTVRRAPSWRCTDIFHNLTSSRISTLLTFSSATYIQRIMLLYTFVTMMVRRLTMRRQFVSSQLSEKCNLYLIAWSQVWLLANFSWLLKML